MSPVRRIVFVAALTGLIAACAEPDYLNSSPRYTPGYTPSGKSYTAQPRDDRPQHRPFM